MKIVLVEFEWHRQELEVRSIKYRNLEDWPAYWCFEKEQESKVIYEKTRKPSWLVM